MIYAGLRRTFKGSMRVIIRTAMKALLLTGSGKGYHEGSGAAMGFKIEGRKG